MIVMKTKENAEAFWVIYCVLNVCYEGMRFSEEKPHVFFYGRQTFSMQRPSA